MILLHAAGGTEIGIGHLSRCQSLALELLRQGARDVVQLYEATQPLAERFAASGAKLVIAPTRSSALELREQLLPPSKPAMLVTDLLDLKKSDATLARRQGFALLAHLNDSHWLDYAPDLLIDGSAFRSPQDFPTTAHTKVLCGPSYHILRPSVAARRPDAPWRQAAVRKVLLCFGGADPGHETELFVRETAKINSPVQFTVIAGPAFPEARRRDLQSLLGPCHHLVNAPSEMSDLILEHDVVVTLGGLTSYEAMCLGRPVFSVAWQHMKPYVEKLAAAGVLLNLGEGERAVQQLFRATDSVGALQQLAETGWKTIDGKGAERSARAILLAGS